jgi:glycosyltransferase involved in cell wall biosynthesis
MGGQADQLYARAWGRGCSGPNIASRRYRSPRRRGQRSLTVRVPAGTVPGKTRWVYATDSVRRHSMVNTVRVVFLSHTHLRGTFVVGSHQLAHEMSLAGHRVAHVSTPLTPFHIARFRDPEVRLRYRQLVRPAISPSGILSVVPLALIPWTVSSRVPSLWRRYAAISYPRIGKLLRHHLGGPVDVVIIDQPKLVGLTTALQPRTVIYRPTDLYHRMRHNSRIAGAEALAIRRAAVVVATSEAVARHVNDVDRKVLPVLLPNGVERRHFALPRDPPLEYRDARRIRAVYVGALDDRFDFQVVRCLARTFPEVEFILIGPGTARSAQVCDGLTNVRALGPRPYSAVPAYLQHAQVGLLPLNDHPANAGRSPMKLYEYGAAGLPVLARYTEEIGRRGDDFVYTYRTAADAADLFRRLITEPSRNGMSAAQLVQHSWEGIAARLLELADTGEPR